MGQTLTVADEEMAYTLSDKATFLAHDDNLKLLKEEAEDMKNTYSLIAITPNVGRTPTMRVPWLSSNG